MRRNFMALLAERTNALDASVLGGMSGARQPRALTGVTPVLATPATVAVGVLVGAAAFGLAFLAGLQGDVPTEQM
jgi:hypothetical protein